MTSTAKPAKPVSLTIGADDFLLDGKPFQIISGSMHYFRVHPDHWADRIHKARLMGLNTLETYVPWSEHFPTHGEFVDHDGLDLRRFLELIAAEGMYAIVRPGPYICAEWDNGGLPAWLFTDPEVGVRRSEPRYLGAVTEFFQAILPIIAPLQIQHGGPVILLQIENEYGAYGDDKEYLRTLVQLVRDGGISVPLTTIDQPTDVMLARGGLPELHKTGSFGSRSTDRLATLRRHQPQGPLMCAEFWDGWFDNWGSHHHTTDVEHSAAELDTLLAAGASVNLYMFHGGTNFGFTNGANDKGVYQPTTTSYDYDAPLTESGDPGPKYWAYREVIGRYAHLPDERPMQRATIASPEISVDFTETISLSDKLPALGRWTHRHHLPTLDEIGHFRGFALYRTTVDRPGLLRFADVRDRAQLFLSGHPIGVLNRDQHDTVAGVPAAGVLEVLVEDQGRVNYGPRIGEPKGLIGPVDLDGTPLIDWDVLPISLSGALDPLSGDLITTSCSDRAGSLAPLFLGGSFDLDHVTDLHLSTEGFGKGVAFVNGFNLGRYWSRGPQASLYVPSPVLREGHNAVVLFELQGIRNRTASFISSVSLGPTEA